MSWTPITREALQQEIDRGTARMSTRQLRLWKEVAVTPTKWALSPWGDRGGGFWVLGVSGGTVIWFNDIEMGFNRSSYSKAGTIGEYMCNQDELQWTIGWMLDEIDGGDGHTQSVGPPEEIV